MSTRVVGRRATRKKRPYLGPATIGFARLTVNGDVMGASPGLCAMLGIEREDLLGRRLQQQVLQPLALDRSIREACKAGLPQTLELVFKAAEQKTFLVVLNCTGHGGRYKRTRSLLASFSDITLLKKTEAALRASEERFRSLFENSILGVYRTSPDGEIIMANPALCRMLKFDNYEELRRRNLEDKNAFSPRYSREMFKKNLEKTGAVVGLEAVWVCKDGSELYIRENARAIRDANGKVLYYEGLVEDISERKRIEDALRMSEERLRLATQVGRMYAFEWHPGTDEVIRIGAEQLFGTGRRSEKDTGKHFISMLHPADREKFMQVACGVTPERPSYEISYRLVRPGNETIWLEERGRGFFWPDGELERIVGIAADVTESKLAQNALHELSARLMHVQEDERRRIARDLHDDIGQDLTLLKLQLDTVSTRWANEEQKTQLKQLRDWALTICEKVRGLSHELHTSQLDLLGLESAARDFARQWADAHGISMSFLARGISRDLDLRVASSFYRVLQEALSNVAKHSHARFVRVRLTSSLGKLKMEISDDGKGLDTDKLVRCPGLGVVSMRERIYAVGGDLTITSKLGKGTTVQAKVDLKAPRSIRGRA